jgi:hypothetical protein
MTSPPQTQRRLTAVIHGDSGVGKSRLAASGPAPRLILDAEAGAEYLPGNIIEWEPLADKPPEKDDSWDTCVVKVREFGILDAAYQWLISGEHPFESVSLDSVSEIQQKCKDALTGPGGEMDNDRWQKLLATMNDKLRAFRDLKTHPTHPLWAVTFVMMTEQRDGKAVPLAQGKLRAMLPYYVDVCGYMEMGYDEAAEEARFLYLNGTASYIAKERVGGRLGSKIINPNLTEMLRTLNTAA